MLSKCLLKICKQVVKFLDADREPNKGIINSHGSPPFSAHFIVDLMSDRYRERSGITQVATTNHKIQFVNKIKTVHIANQFDAEYPTMMAE